MKFSTNFDFKKTKQFFGGWDVSPAANPSISVLTRIKIRIREFLTDFTTVE